MNGLSKREFDLIAYRHGLAAAEVAAAMSANPPMCDTGRPAMSHTAHRLVDLRCPESMGKLLGRTRPVLHADGMVELACGNCTREFRRAGLNVARVVHRYNLLGEPLATEITPAPAADPPAQ